MQQGKHLTCEDLREIISLKSSMNKGLNDNLKKEFPGLIKNPRPIYSSLKKLNLHWLLGFI